MKTINTFSGKLFLALILAFAANVFSYAYDFKVGDLCYTILNYEEVAVVGENYAPAYAYLPSTLEIPSQVVHMGNTYTVTEIGDYAFQACKMLESVIIPNTVKKIGFYVFTGCTKLLNISFPESLEDVMGGALYECAWYNNQPDGLVYVGNLLYRYKGTAPVGTIEVREGTKAILDFAFSQQSNIQSVVLPSSVTSVHLQAFANCANLETIVLPDSLSVIDDEAFTNCVKLTAIKLPQILSIIGEGAFSGCSNLSQIEWPQHMISIGASAFYECTQLDNVEAIPASIQKIGANAFYNTAWENRQPAGYLYIHNIFYAYTGELTENLHINIKHGTTYISGGAVSHCWLTNGRYRENVVTKLTIPTTVREIEDRTFASCNKLDTIICAADMVPVIGENTFSTKTYENSKLLVFDYLLTYYQYGDFWRNFVNIQPITDYSSFNPKTFMSDGFYYNIINDTIAPFEVEITYTWGAGSSFNTKNYTELTTLHVPSAVEYQGAVYNVTRIGEYAFNGAQKLQQVTMGENIKTIDRFAVMNCPKLAEVQIGESVDSILLDAFSFGKLQQLTIPKNVKYIAPLIVRNNPITSIKVDPENTNYTSINGVLFNKTKNVLHTFPAAYATEYTIPESVDTIGSCAFAGTSIKSVVFPKNLVHIVDDAFRGTRLTELVLPASLQSIGMYAFDMCTNLTKVTCYATTPPIMSDGESEYKYHVFLRVPVSDIPLYVPAESIEAYKNADQWKDFGQILPIEQTPEDLFPTLTGLQRTSCTKTIGEDEYGTVWGSRSYLMQEIETATIDGKQYIVFGDEHEYDRFALREENNKILVYSSILKKDLVLYDFTLEVGDSLPALYFEWRAHDTMQQWLYNGDIVDYNKDDEGTILPAETFVVTAISTITLLDGKEYKKWTFDNGMEYVEGIGSFGTSYAWNDFYQLIANGPLYSDVHSQHLVCASKNGQLLYKMDDAEIERLGAECLCEVETSYKSQWCNTWNVFTHSGGARLDSEETWQYKLDRDTIINGKLYSTVIYYLTSDPSQEYYMGAVRFGDDRKVYRAIGNSESVVYDFTAQVGDTLGPGVVYDVEVDSLTNLKTIYFHPYDRYEDEYIEYATVKWIEGVGSTDGFLLAKDYGTVGGASFYLLCAYRDDELKYAANKDLGCRYNAGEVTHDHFPTLAGLSRTIHEERSTNDTTRRDDFTKVVLDLNFPTLYHSQMYLRERDNKIFVESRTYKNLTELYEYVLYDFTLEVGDSLPMLYIDYSSRGNWGPTYPLSILNVVNYRKEADGTIYPGDTLVVTEVSTITLLDGKEYKKWTFNNGMEYAEGIGSLSGDFYELIANKRTTEDLTASQLVCASQNGQLLYKMDDAEMERLGAECLCDYTSGPKKDNAKDGQIGGRPTPTQWNMLEMELRKMENGVTILQAETFSYILEDISQQVNNKTYFQLTRQSTKDTATTKSVVGALHFGKDEDNRVYFLRDGVEYVLYDFTAEPGDTVEIFAGVNNYPQETTYTHVVTGKDTLENGACRMILEVVFPDETTTAENAEKVWLAGLGSIDGIVHNAASRASNARSSETQTSVMLCAWRDDDCLYTTDHPDYDTLGCVYNTESTGVGNTTSSTSYQKILRNGQLLILHQGRIYNVIGVEIK